MKIIRDAVKEIWKGALQAIGAIALAAGGGWLLSHTPAARGWALDHLGPLVGPGKIDLTIFLGGLSAALFALWIVARISLYRLRRRVRKDTLNLADIIGSGKDGFDRLKALLPP
jgi:hypothetical protein